MFQKHLVHQLGRTLVHAATQATRAETPPFATEGHQMPLAATLTMHLREAMRQDAAFQELLQLLRHELRQAAPG
jgi:hypothetical protein